MKSLQWLRGWVQPLSVQSEYQQLRAFSETSRTCAECQQLAIECKHLKSSYLANIKSLAHKRIQKPFLLCVLMEIFMQFSALLSMRPYIIQIFKAHGIQLDASLVAVYMSIVSNASCLCLVFVIKIVGKRRLFLGSSMTCAILCFALGENCSLNVSLFQLTNSEKFYRLCRNLWILLFPAGLVIVWK